MEDKKCCTKCGQKDYDNDGGKYSYCDNSACKCHANMNEKVLFALNEQRLLVFMECEDGKFRQVALEAAQFKKVSDAIIVSIPPEEQHDLREGMEIAQYYVNPDWEMDADKFLGLSSITDVPDEIE